MRTAVLAALLALCGVARTTVRVPVHVVAGVNHLFLDDADGNPTGYARLPSKRIPDRVMSILTDWIAARTAK